MADEYFQIMVETYQKIYNAASSAMDHIQTYKVMDFNQVLDVLSAHQIEVIAVVAIILALQFTKVTIILITACLIAFCIFYMWDTWFPELNQGQISERALPKHYSNHTQRPSISRNFEASNYPNSNLRDARTSALFPPFSNEGDTATNAGDYSENQINPLQKVHPSSMNIVPDTAKRASLSTSGSDTPIGQQSSRSDFRPNRRQNQHHYDDPRMSRHPAERDIHTFRRMITNEYRAYRPGASTEHNSNRPPNPFDEHRFKWVNPMGQAPPENRKKSNKQRPTYEFKSSTSKKSPAREQLDRMRPESRENLLRKLRNYPGFANRSNGPYHRYEPTTSTNMSQNRGTKRRSFADYNPLNKLKFNRWSL